MCSKPPNSFVTIETVIQGMASRKFTPEQLPLGNEEFSALRGQWLREDEVELSIYREYAISWLVEFGNYLGDTVIMSYDQDTLTLNAKVKVYDNTVKGLNPQSAMGFHIF